MAPRRIDVHFHIAPKFYQDAVLAVGSAPAIGRFPDSNPEVALKTMEANGIETAITSIAAPGVYCLPADQARQIARKCNEYSAELKTRLPGQFGSFALLPMHNADDAIRELEFTLDVLKFDGVFLFASYGGKFLGDQYFDPALEALNRRGAVAFIHPGGGLATQHPELPYPAFLMEYPFDTTRAAVHLLFSGALERFPQIRFILSHAGGALPYLTYRLMASVRISPKLRQLSTEQITAGLRHFWYDTALSTGPATMAGLETVAAPNQVVFGSDFPFATAQVIADQVKNLSGNLVCSDTQKAAIDRDNALQLFPRLAKSTPKA